MKTKLIEFFKSTTGRYIVVGVTVYIFELLVIWLAQKLGAGSLLAVAISFWFGLLISFALQKVVTFQDNRMHRKVVLKQFLAVTALVIFNFFFTLLITKLLAPILTTFGARTLALGITVIWNFYLYKKRIFSGAEPLVD